MINHWFRLHLSDGEVLELPVACEWDGRTFMADQPVTERELDITRVEIIGKNLGRGVCFEVEFFSLSEGEGGQWTMRINKDEIGETQHDLEYYATEQDGMRIHCLAVQSWDHEKKAMTGD